MAEAHSAVAFNFSITHDGVSVSFDQELLRNIWHSIAHSYKRRIGQFKNNFLTGIYPATPGTLLVSILIFALPRLCGFRLDRGWVDTLHDHWPVAFVPFDSLRLLVAIVTFATLFWLLSVQLMRNAVKLLFMYKGFMFEPHGKMSVVTKIWLFLVSVIGKHRPMLQSFQGSLPRLPLPCINATLDAHLKSVRPILSDEEYAEMLAASDEFRKTLGPKFQKWLMLKAWWASNYVTDWWEEYVYLRGRSPIMVNSNYYGLDTLFSHPTTNQAARAANVTYAALQFRRSIWKQELEPIMHCGVPLCSAQYERLFNTTRIPGEEADHLRTFSISKHVAVYHRGAWYRLPVHTSLRLLTPAELQANYQRIIDEAPAHVPSIGEERLAALTAGSRAPWGKARKDFFKAGLNKNSLRVIESAAFVVVLDTEDRGFDRNDPTKLDCWARSLLHGNGHDRWYDKTINLVIARNGRVGANAEHSWGDAPVMAHLLEHLTWADNTQLKGDAPIVSHFFEFLVAQEYLVLKYKENGDVMGEVTTTPPPPERLRWEISEQCQEVIDASYDEAKKLGSEVDMALLVFEEYGKGFVKKQGVSPDAYIQMAIQATYFQLEAKFGLTYEASMTRLYREGRTETVRSVTHEVCDFVRAYADPSQTDMERMRLMRAASERHQTLYRTAMTGGGVDRHLFALYVVSKYLELESPFLTKVISTPWIVSTSQTPHQQTKLLDLRKNPEFVSAGGGFGPVSDSGYGISYIIGGEDVVSFHISSKRPCPTTDSAKFRATLVETLRGFRCMAEAEAKANKAAAKD